MALQFRPYEQLNRRPSNSEQIQLLLQNLNQLGDTYATGQQQQFDNRNKMERQNMLDQYMKSEEARKQQMFNDDYGPQAPQNSIFNAPKSTTSAQGYPMSQSQPQGGGLIEMFDDFNGQQPPRMGGRKQREFELAEASSLADIDYKKAQAEKARRPESSYVIPQLDAQGKIIGYTPLPAGTRPAPFARPSSSATKGILSTPQQQNAYELYEQAKQGLLSGLGGTNTGPIAGLMPSFTRGQQVAEGSVAAMAPVLKQLFRVAGEGVFTDRDQQLLLDMIPTRKTDEAAIPTIISNIDNIVKAKLGITGDNALQTEFNTVEEAEAANLPPGTRIRIGGRSATVK